MDEDAELFTTQQFKLTSLPKKKVKPAYEWPHDNTKIFDTTSWILAAKSVTSYPTHCSVLFDLADYKAEDHNTSESKLKALSTNPSWPKPICKSSRIQLLKTPWFSNLQCHV
jgi:hypothetical protein